MKSPPGYQAGLREDLASFIAHSFNSLLHGEIYQHNWHIDVIAWHLEKCLRGEIKRLIITIPPRNLKSICASIAFIAWALGRDPTLKFISVSYSQELSRKHASDCRAIMESDFYGDVFPDAVPLRAVSTEITTRFGGQRLATSVGGTITGRGGNFLVQFPNTRRRAWPDHQEREYHRRGL